ncbi:flagellar basal-body MS-ring/collar protein FliF [Inmirania thermothiophila]|uniref:Flagellar M-ring protein n=1 Tax=Inmirania thermothiophila TaxID=1750597 RepID=A0A3N1Y7X9_9GAMM|nr:flagellar basal-body MS-ring/collar protein FliF [Inmirania thermothiophila]ROR34929.1 flagellar M-ring protein FliF [Inmirania thermothiophila]
MAVVKLEDLGASVSGLGRMPVVRQVAAMVGVAAAVAIGVAVALWAQRPPMVPLYGSLAAQDAAEVAEALRQAGASFRLDPATGAILVPEAKVHELRLRLAEAGLPRGADTGFELLDQQQGFGTSRFIEQARYQRALEGELARTISALASVESARVHLAVPRPSVFLREREEPSASVLVRLRPGRTLERPQVDAIVHLVASSVPGLKASRVKVVDHKGRLLTRDESGLAGLSTRQLEYQKAVEERYAERVRQLLAPVVGADGVRVQVAADLDFTATEFTRESFDPQRSAVRSEESSEEVSGGAEPAGVPGALSNQPPAEPELVPGAQPVSPPEQSPVRNSARRVVRNYEIDRTISHVREPVGRISRLSVAVLVDDRVVTREDGTTARQPRTPEEMERITALVRQAVGFDQARGDTVSVINASFQPPAAPEPLPEPALWERPWVWALAKQVAAAALILLLILVVLRPLVRGAAQAGAAPPPAPALPPGAGGAAQPAQLQGPQPQRPASFEEQLGAAQTVASQDPKRAAQVVKTWLASDG